MHVVRFLSVVEEQNLFLEDRLAPAVLLHALPSADMGDGSMDRRQVYQFGTPSCCSTIGASMHESRRTA